MRSPRLLFGLFYCLWCASAANGQHFTIAGQNYQPAKKQEDAFSRLQAHFHRYVDDSIFTGTAMLLAKGDEMHTDLYGLQDREANLRMTPTTIFRIASMTKPITSVAAMMLVETGQLQLDDPVEKYLPAFKNLQVYVSEDVLEKPRTVLTVTHLLTHTGGISSGFDPSPAGQICNKILREHKPDNLQELALALAEAPLAFHPGEGWVYSYSTDVLAAVIEQVANRSLDQFFKEKIFGPLKMHDTGFQVPADKLDRFAALYGNNVDKRLQLLEAGEGSPYTKGANYPRGNGGLTSTLTDYYRFARMLLQGGQLDGVRILSTETVALMTRNHLPEKLLPISVAGDEMTGQGFGLGFSVLSSETPFGSAGDFYWPGATYTYFFVSPQQNAVGIFMAQLLDMEKRYILNEFHDLAGRFFAVMEEHSGEK